MRLSMESKSEMAQKPHLAGADRSSPRWVREGLYKFSFELRKYAMLPFLVSLESDHTRSVLGNPPYST